MSAAAHASLIVAIGLAIATVAARAGMAANVGRRVAEDYLEALSNWTLIAVTVNVLAVVAAGEASVSRLWLPVFLGAIAVLAQRDESEPEPDEPELEPEPAAPAPPPPRAAHVGSLWARH